MQRSRRQAQQPLRLRAPNPLRRHRFLPARRLRLHGRRPMYSQRTRIASYAGSAAITIITTDGIVTALCATEPKL
jgi:hypothetical protein